MAFADLAKPSPVRPRGFCGHALLEPGETCPSHTPRAVVKPAPLRKEPCKVKAVLFAGVCFLLRKSIDFEASLPPWVSGYWHFAHTVSTLRTVSALPEPSCSQGPYHMEEPYRQFLKHMPACSQGRPRKPCSRAPHPRRHFRADSWGWEPGPRKPRRLI